MIVFKSGEKACRAALRLCSRRADGAVLTEREENDRAAHLAVCPACQKKDAALVAQSALLRSMAASSQTSPLAEGAIAARAVSSWRMEQSRAQTFGFPAQFDKRFAFGLAALVAIAGAGTAARLATDKSHKTDKIAQSPKAASPVEGGRLAVNHAAKTTTQPVRIPGSVLLPVGTQSNPAPFVSVAPRPHSPVVVSHFPQRKWRGVEPVLVAPSPMRTLALPNVAANGAISDDMAYLNGSPSQSASFAGRWLNLTPDAAQKLQAEIEKTIRTGDEFVDVPFPLIASTNGYDSTTVNAISRYRQEREIVDARLQRKITLGKKRVSFSDLCAHLETQTGISFAANKSVADDKITIFCTDRPLRDLMREIATLFNFTWQRSGEEGAYQYRVTQPLRAQLVEEELRNHDRNEALVALDKEMEKYKALAHLSPDEAKARGLSATDPAEKKMYEHLAGVGWGAVQMYASLGPDQLAALRDGQALDFSSADGARGALSSSVASGIKQALNGEVWFQNEHFFISNNPAQAAHAVSPASVPDAIALARLQLFSNELGQFTLTGWSGVGVSGKDGPTSTMTGRDLAVGRSPSSQNPQNETANAALKNEDEWQKTAQFPARDKTDKKARSKITTADVLEAVHKATGQDVIGDYYTRLYDPSIVFSAPPRPLFDLLCDVSDKAHLRWNKAENWLTFRSANFFNDRPKEVPNRLLERWASARQENKSILPPEYLPEIAQLTDAQLSASFMVEGAKVLYGLEEWDAASRTNLRESWRLIASLPKYQQKAVLGDDVLRFDQLTPAQQERFAAQVLDKRDTVSLVEKLAGATLEVAYQAARTRAGDFNSEPDVSFIYRYNTERGPMIKKIGTYSEATYNDTSKTK